MSQQTVVNKTVFMRILGVVAALLALLAVPGAARAASYNIACGGSANNSLNSQYDTYSFTLASRSRVTASFSTAFTGTYYIVQIDDFGADPTRGSGSNTATLNAGSHTLLFIYVPSISDPPNYPVAYNLSLSCEPVATPVPTASPIPTSSPIPTAIPTPTVSPVPTATPRVPPTCNGACSPSNGFNCSLDCDTAVCGTLEGSDFWLGGSVPGDKYYVHADSIRSTEFNLSLQSQDSGWQYVLALFKDDESIPRADAGAVGGNVARLDFTLPAGSSGYYVVVTYFDNGTFVPAWPKSYQLTSLCTMGPAPTPTPAPLECLPGSIFSQPSNLEPQADQYTGTMSEKGQYAVFERFSGLPDAITGVRWWSFYLSDFSSPCTKASTPRFEVSFFADNSNASGPLVAGPYTLTSTGLATGASFDGNPVIQYELGVPRLDLRSGWISIVGLPDSGSPGCVNFWITAPGSDRLTIVRDATNTYAQPYDSAFCLTTQPVSLLLGDVVTYGSDTNQDGVLDAGDLGRQ